MDYNSLTISAKSYVETFVKNQKGFYCFHDNQHTMDVVKAAQEISNHYQLSDREKAAVIIAAYFHDVGYLSGGAQDHERRSADLAESFLREQHIDEDFRQMVTGCILATKVPQKPTNLLQQILCDADLFHLGLPSFEDRNKLMRKEAELVLGKKIKKQEWKDSTILFLQSQHYHTDYAQNLLTACKEENLNRLMNESTEEINKEELDSSKKTKKNDKPDRGIETMFRVTSANNQRLSDMADNKANILITVNSIILSLVISLLLRKLDNNEHLMIPTVILLAVSLSTMVTAILSTIPRIPSGYFSPEDLSQKKVNLLFFGNFFKMGFNDYHEGMKIVMNDREFLYDTLIRDVYSQGVVLGRKYKFIRLAYNIFMYGLIASVVSFLLAVII